MDNAGFAGPASLPPRVLRGELRDRRGPLRHQRGELRGPLRRAQPPQDAHQGNRKAAGRRGTHLKRLKSPLRGFFGR